MKIEEKHELLKNWMIKKYNQSKNWNNGIWLFYDGGTNNLILITTLFLKWQELLNKGYSEEQLVDYFIEIVRYYLPELKGTKLYFSLNMTDDKIYKII